MFNHSFFKGNIGFLLPKGENSEFKKFTMRKAIAMQLFDDKGLTVGKKDNLFGRVLLALGLNLKNGEELWLGGKSHQYWKDQLKDNHFTVSIRKGIDLLLGFEKDSFEDKLKSELNNRLESPELDVWKKHLIENPKIFSEYSCYGRIIRNWRGINIYEREKFNSNVNAILIENNRNEVITDIIKNWNFRLTNNSQRCGKFYTGETIELKSKNESFKLTFSKEEVIVQVLLEENQVYEGVEKIKFTDAGNSIRHLLEENFPQYFPISKTELQHDAQLTTS